MWHDDTSIDTRIFAILRQWTRRRRVDAARELFGAPLVPAPARIVQLRIPRA
jgi:hypothetical protein